MPFVSDQTLAGERLQIYALIKMLKHFTGSSIKSYMVKFALNMSNLSEDNANDLGFNIRRVLRHWTIKDKFSSVHPELKTLGIIRVEVGDNGFIFHRKDFGWSAKQEEVKEGEKEKARGNCECALGRFIKSKFWNFDNSPHFLGYKYHD